MTKNNSTVLVLMWVFRSTSRSVEQGLDSGKRCDWLVATRIKGDLSIVDRSHQLALTHLIDSLL